MRYVRHMFEWIGFAGRLASGDASPLDAVAALAELSNRALLEQDQDEALAVIEITQAALAALGAVQALSVEAFARREQEDIDLVRADARARGMVTHGLRDAHDVVPAMLAPVFHLAPRTMANVLGETQLLVNDLPTTLALVRAGRLEVSRARAVADEAILVDPSRRDRYETELYGRGGRSGDQARPDHVTGLTYGSLRKRASRAAVRVDPDAAKRRAALGLRDREVRIRPGADPGMTAWWAAQPADVSLRAWTVIDALAAEYVAGQPALTIAQARDDAMMNLILGQATITTVVDLLVPIVDTIPAPARGTATGESSSDTSNPNSDAGADTAITSTGSPDWLREPEANGDTARATILRIAFDDLSTTLGLLDCAIGVCHQRVGILLNEQVTALLADPDTALRLHHVDPGTGCLTRHDPRTYRPAAALSRAVRARDGTCRMPGCTTPAVRCQLDHVIPFPRGLTTIENLACLCTTHHGFKHHAGWQLSMTPGGTCTWRSPLDRSYTTRPQDHRDLAA